MQVQNGRKTSLPQFQKGLESGPSGGIIPLPCPQNQRFVHGRMMGENGRVWGLNQDALFEFRAPSVQSIDERQRQDCIPQRAQANQKYVRDLLKLLTQRISFRDRSEGIFRFALSRLQREYPLTFLDFCFVDQHYRDVIANGINAMTFYAFKPAAIRCEAHFLLAQRACQNFQKFFADCHRSPSRSGVLRPGSKNKFAFRACNEPPYVLIVSKNDQACAKRSPKKHLSRLSI